VEWVVTHKDLAEALSYWATTGGIGIALIAGLAAYWRYRQDVKRHEWDRAREAYARFLELAIANPEFHPGSYSEVAVHDRVARNKYVWFMARFLWACEEVLKSCPDDPEVWHSAFRVVILEHRDYFLAPEGQAEIDCYYPPLKELIQEVLKEIGGEKAPAPNAARADLSAVGPDSSVRLTGPEGA
jgi:hypothetical protein